MTALCCPLWTMAVELAPFGILVNAVAPGPTQVERTAHGPKQKAAMLARLAIKRYAQPDEIAAAVAFLVSEENTRRAAWQSGPFKQTPQPRSNNFTSRENLDPH